MLRQPYSYEIDMWSFGCILAELFLGYPLFHGECEVEQMACLMEVLGLPPDGLLERASRSSVFFDGNQPVKFINSRGKCRRPGGKNFLALFEEAGPGFIGLLGSCLEWEPEKRISAQEAMGHEWISNLL